LFLARLSAIAVAKARAAEAQQEALSLSEKAKLDSETQIPGHVPQDDTSALTTLLSSFPLSYAHEAVSDDDDDNAGAYSSDEQVWTEKPLSRSYRPSYQSKELSSFQPTKNNVISHTPARLVLKLKADETVTFIGEYDLEVTAGIVVIYGAAIRTGDKPQRILAPSTHALPTIMAKGGAAEIAIISTGLPMVGLSRLSPVWGRLWNARDNREAGPEGESTADRSFMFVCIPSASH